jgi:hypothetical protein
MAPFADSHSMPVAIPPAITKLAEKNMNTNIPTSFFFIVSNASPDQTLKDASARLSAVWSRALLAPSEWIVFCPFADCQF